MVALLIIALIIVVFKCIKSACEDEAVRRHSAELGLPFYPSSTGLRNTKTGEKYYKQEQSALKATG